MDIDAKTLEQLSQRVVDARAFLHIDDKEAELAKLDEDMENDLETLKTAE